MEPIIPEFGDRRPGVEYVLRPGGYAVILDHEGNVAVVVTARGVMLPGGGQNEGESPEAAAIREVEEECAWRIALGARLGVADELVFADEERTEYRKRCTFFLARVASKSEAGEQEHEVAWLPASEACKRLSHASQRWAVAEMLRAIQGKDGDD